MKLNPQGKKQVDVLMGLFLPDAAAVLSLKREVKLLKGEADRWSEEYHTIRGQLDDAKRISEDRCLHLKLELKSERRKREEWMIKWSALKKSHVTLHEEYSRLLRSEYEGRATRNQKTTMSKEEDPYAVMGVSRSASSGFIASVYKDLRKLYHPDKASGDPTNARIFDAKYKTITAAYEQIMKDRS